MAQELDAIEIVNFTLKQVSNLPKVANCRNNIFLAHLLCHLLYTDALVSLGILKDIDTSKSFFAEVLANDSNKDPQRGTGPR